MHHICINHHHLVLRLNALGVDIFYNMIGNILTSYVSNWWARQAAWRLSVGSLVGAADDMGAPSERLVNQVTSNARSGLGDLSEPYLRHIENKAVPNRSFTTTHAYAHYTSLLCFAKNK